MALYTDGPPSSIDDLSAQDSQLLSVASTEQIDVTQKLMLAHEQVGIEVEALLRRMVPAGYRTGIEPGPKFESVVVTKPLQLWHTYMALTLVYGDAYYNQLNDRYARKRDDFEQKAKWAYEKVLAAGLGMVAQPAAASSHANGDGRDRGARFGHLLREYLLGERGGRRERTVDTGIVYGHQPDAAGTGRNGAAERDRLGRLRGDRAGSTDEAERGAGRRRQRMATAGSAGDIDQRAGRRTEAVVLLSGPTTDAEGLMASTLGNAATNKVVTRFSATSGLGAELGALTAGSSGGMTLPLIKTQNIAADLAERTTGATYPAMQVYCEKITNDLTEKFRSFSGRVQMAIELRHSQDRIDGLQDTLELYADGATQVLTANRGDWGDGMYYTGGYQVTFGPVKQGGRNFIQVAKVTFEIGVSRN